MPVRAAASSLERPNAIRDQKRRRSDCLATPGRPGERNLRLVDCSDLRLPVVIATSISRVLRRPVETAQYASQSYRDALDASGLRGSMSSVGNPYHNAQAESFMKTLKVEEVYRAGYETFADVAVRLPIFIEQIYNTRRLHSALSYRTPEEFETLFAQKAA